MKDEKTGTVTLERELPAPPERVFRALTNPDDLATWWKGMHGISRAVMDLRPGGKYRFEYAMPNGQIAVVHGIVREVESPRRLVMTWFSPDHPNLETVVSFHLEPKGKGTLLKLRHTGLTDPKALEGHLQGWLEALGLLVTWFAAAGPMFTAGAQGSRDR